MTIQPGNSGHFRPLGNLRATREQPILDVATGGGGVMAKRHSRPSAQYRYEHYDPR